MTKGRKIWGIISIMALMLVILTVSASAAKVKMYAADGRTVTIDESAVQSYKNVGWYTQPVTKMFSADGRMVVVAYTAVDDYRNVGWYEAVTMYAADGRINKVSPFKIASYESVGWYIRPVTKMYAADGRTIVISKDYVEQYKKVGWYTSPVQKPAPAPAAKPAVKMDDMQTIGNGGYVLANADKLTDNYGKKYNRALINKADNTYWEYLLDGKYTRFTGTLYVPSGEKGNDVCQFIIKAEGKVIYETPKMTKISRPVNIDISLKGYNHVEMYFTDDNYSTSDVDLYLANPLFYPA